MRPPRRPRHAGFVAAVHVTTVEIDGPSRRFMIPVATKPADVRLDPGTWTRFRARFRRHGGRR